MNHRYSAVEKPYRIQNKKSVVFLGDLNGSFAHLNEACAKNNSCAIIAHGNLHLGINPIESELMMLEGMIQDNLKKNDNTLVYVRGSRDSGKRVEELRNRLLFTNIFIPKTNELFYINDKTFLAIGGGIPFDRSQRIIGESYWGEGVDIHTIPPTMPAIDVLVTYSSPAVCAPVDLGPLVLERFKEKDETLLEDIEMDRKRLYQQFDKLKPALHVCSYFNIKRTETIGDCTHRCLSIREEWIVDIDEIPTSTDTTIYNTIEVDEIKTTPDENTNTTLNTMPEEPNNPPSTEEEKLFRFQLKKINETDDSVMTFTFTGKTYNEVAEKAFAKLGCTFVRLIDGKEIGNNKANKANNNTKDRISMVKFFKENEIDPEFDLDFYMSQHDIVESKKIYENFYQPRCKEKGISDLQRLYYHYFFFGKERGKAKNKEEYNQRRVEVEKESPHKSIKIIESVLK